MFLIALLFLTHHSTRCKLHNRLNLQLEVYPCPVIILEVKIKHVIRYLFILILPSKHNHRATKYAATVIFPGLHTDPFCLDDAHGLCLNIVHHHLCDALSHLSLSVEHVAASETVDLALVDCRGVSASSIDLLVGIGGGVVDVVPLRIVVLVALADDQLSYFFVGVVVLSSNKVSSVSAEREG
jgi:hypothetical protein